MSNLTHSYDSGANVVAYAPKKPTIASNLHGVGGWLLVFIVAQLIYGPFYFLAVHPESTFSHWAEMIDSYPVAASLLIIERSAEAGITLFGVIVAIYLVKGRSYKPISLTKTFLMISPVVSLLLAILIANSDLQEPLYSSVVSTGIIKLAFTCVSSLIWYRYFTSSKRVRATYYWEPE